MSRIAIIFIKTGGFGTIKTIAVLSSDFPYKVSVLTRGGRFERQPGVSGLPWV